MSQDIFVVAEHLKGQLADVSFELLGKGRELADASGGALVAVLLGQGVEGLAAELGAADKLLYVEHATLAEFNPEPYGRALTEVVFSQSPRVVLIPNTSIGMDLASTVSVRGNLPLVAYAVDVKLVDGKLVAESQLYGGKMNVESEIEGASAIVSVIAGALPIEAGKKDGAPAVEKIAVSANLDDLKVRFKTLIEPEAGDVDITQQDVLVSVGRGIGSDENLATVQALADALGGALSCSRPIVDSKWLPKTRQVGKSGLKVKPKAYIAVGVSGAPEHIEGMKDAELIIAINTDPKAPIFDVAHYGVTSDLFDIVPALIEKLKG
ncbi:MAG: electron transfer flavoprotein subunit alpha/FixB family protein [Acidobacteriota bacterium]|nr:MAG: electron transfer flavoprotein subunit alpha/FixB family protein [Acidobacteriota bacterium]